MKKDTVQETSTNLRERYGYNLFLKKKLYVHQLMRTAETRALSWWQEDYGTKNRKTEQTHWEIHSHTADQSQNTDHGHCSHLTASASVTDKE